MKKLSLLILVSLSLFVPSVRAQKTDGDNLGEITFEELKDKEKSSQYFAVGGGFVGSFLFYNKDNINKSLPTTFKIKDFKAPMFVSGGQGFITFFFKNIRFGVSAAIGTQTVDTTLGTGDTAVTRHVDFSSSFNGLTIDYALPLFKGFTILPGIQGGIGNMIFERYDGKNSDSWTGVPTSSGSNMSRLEVSQYYVQPTLNIEYALTTFTMFRANVGYAMTFPGSTWTLNRTTSVSNAPSDLKSSGLVAGFGVFFGLFRNE